MAAELANCLGRPEEDRQIKKAELERSSMVEADISSCLGRPEEDRQIKKVELERSSMVEADISSCPDHEKEKADGSPDHLKVDGSPDHERRGQEDKREAKKPREAKRGQERPREERSREAKGGSSRGQVPGPARGGPEDQGGAVLKELNVEALCGSQCSQGKKKSM